MPPLCLHLALARDASGGLELEEESQAAYLLGSTLPDAHLLFPLRREETHFMDLACLPEEEEMERQSLKAFGPLDRQGQFLAAGYLCHLETDMVWIKDIYQPCFGPSSPLGADPLAAVKDRALQYELDRRERENRAGMALVRHLLGRLMPLPAPSFLGGGSLAPWQQFILQATLRESDWGRFSLYAQNYLLPRGKIGPQGLEAFLQSLPAAVGELVAYVGEERLKAFRKRAIAWSVRAAQDHLL